MATEYLALTLYFAQSAGTTTVAAAFAALFALQFGFVVVLRRIFRSDGSDGDDPGSDGGGSGRRRDPAPGRPPPDGIVCWPSSSASSPITSPGWALASTVSETAPPGRPRRAEQPPKDDVLVDLLTRLQHSFEAVQRRPALLVGPPRMVHEGTLPPGRAIIDTATASTPGSCRSGDAL